MRVDHGEMGEFAPPEPVSVPPAAEVGSYDAGVRSETSPVAGAPPGAGKSISVAMLLLGVGLLWPVPLGGALFLVAGGFGLAISNEVELTQAAPATANPPVAPQASVATPFDPQPEGFLVT
jgi:hypothetical protein